MDVEQIKIKSAEQIIQLIENKKFQEAEKELLFIIKKKKENYQTYFLLGNIYALLKKQKQAIEYLNKSIKLNSDNKVAHYFLGLVLDEVDELENSKLSFEKALKLDPEYLYANLALALNYEKQNNFNKAKEFFEKTLSIKNDFILGNQKYANFLIKIGEITKGQYYTYKYAGVIRIKEKVIKNSNIVRESGPENKNFIGCWNIKNNNLCENIVNFFEQRKDLHHKGEISQSGKNEEAKKSIDISLNPRNLNEKGFENIKLFIETLQECFEDYKNQWPFLKNNINVLDIPSFNIQKYEIGGHFNMMHCERANLQSMQRVFAWMTYLNDVEDGGGTYFEHFNLRIKPTKGKTLIWPAEWTHAHRGEILNKGNKYIITGWMNFPFNFRL